MLRGLIRAAMALAWLAFLLLILFSVFGVVLAIVPKGMQALSLGLTPFRMAGWATMGIVPIFLLALFVCVMIVVGRAIGALAERDREAEPEDSRMLQEVHRGLARMEERIDALETILLSERRRRTSRREPAETGRRM